MVCLSEDEQILIKIQKYLRMLAKLYAGIESLSSAELDESVEALALVQCVTNLFGLSSKLSDDTVAAKLALLSSGRIMRFRNIAEDDINPINWDIAKRNSRTIIDNVTDICINECFEILTAKKANS